MPIQKERPVTSTQPILVNIEEGVATITLNRPAALNALTTGLVDEMLATLDRLEADSAVRVLLLTGAGRAFSSGADLAGDVSGPPLEDFGVELETHLNPLCERLTALRLPIVAAVNGPAAGAGCSLALAADFVLAGRSAYFLQAFVNIALIPDAGAFWMLPRLVGKARALEMMMLGERISAEQAADWGMIYRCVDDADLMDQARELARRLASGPTKTYALIRQGARLALEQPFADTLAMERRLQNVAGHTEDFREGVAAFLEKRRPRFRGR